jgi:hypothetical protein
MELVEYNPIESQSFPDAVKAIGLIQARKLFTDRLNQGYKICPVCKQVKSVDEFHKRSDRPAGTHSKCKDCSAQASKIIYEKYRRKNKCIACGKEGVKKSMCFACMRKNSIRGLERRRKLKRKAVKFLGGVCLECGLKTDDVCIYDFHHVEKAKENKIVGLLVSRKWEDILSELKKCVLLCARCHQIRHEKLDDEQSKFSLEASRKGTSLRREKKRRAIEYKGGQCSVCGFKSDYLSIFDFHHRDPKSKIIKLSRAFTIMTFEELKKELDMCDLTCCNCHRIEHVK